MKQETTVMPEVAEVATATENAEVATTEVANAVEAVSTKKYDITPADCALLGFAGVGVLATGYGAYKGIKWLVAKVKAKKAAQVEEAEFEMEEDSESK